MYQPLFALSVIQLPGLSDLQSYSFLCVNCDLGRIVVLLQSLAPSPAPVIGKVGRQAWRISTVRKQQQLCLRSACALIVMASCC